MPYDDLPDFPLVSITASDFEPSAFGMKVDVIDIESLNDVVKSRVLELPYNQRWPQNGEDLMDGLKAMGVKEQRAECFVFVLQEFERKFGAMRNMPVSLKSVVELLVAKGVAAGINKRRGDRGERNVGGDEDGRNREGSGGAGRDKEKGGDEGGEDTSGGSRVENAEVKEGKVSTDSKPPLVYIDRPTLPLLVQYSAKHILDPEMCPQTVHFYHGSDHIDAKSVISFQSTGVLRSSAPNYYSRDKAAYFTSSVEFAIWWAARQQLWQIALYMDHRQKIEYARDKIPEALNQVSCILVECKWSKEDLYAGDPEDWHVLWERKEEEEVGFIFIHELNLHTNVSV